MPKIFNTSWLAVILATLAFYMVGFAIYGFLFQDAWLTAAGLTEEQAQAVANSKGSMMFVWGLLITLAQALGVLWLIDRVGAIGVGRCLGTVFWAFVMLGAPLLAYAVLYQGYGDAGILIDYAHILIGWSIMAFIYAMFRGKDA